MVNTVSNTTVSFEKARFPFDNNTAFLQLVESKKVVAVAIKNKKYASLLWIILTKITNKKHHYFVEKILCYSNLCLTLHPVLK